VTRTWRMFAGRTSGGVLHGFGDEHTVRFRGLTPEPVEVIEDPDGDYWGWIDLPTKHRAFVSGVPTMIQGREGIFRIQSPDGFRSDVEAGRGEIVRLTCRAVDEN
jgi:hypothetical protein